MAKWKHNREFAKCKSCGKSLADKPTKQKYCSIKCCNIDKNGIERKDCWVERVCKCGAVGWGQDFWNVCRGMCWECCKITPHKAKTGGHKNRVYKTCKCGFVGYGIRDFPQHAKGDCLQCWTKKIDRGPLNQCKVCRKDIVGSYQRNPKAKVYCSQHCRDEKKRLNKIVVQCCICGKSSERYKSRLEIRSEFACSLECQRKHALVDNHSFRNVDWVAKSKKAKKAFEKSRHEKRLLERYGDYLKRIGKELGKARVRVDTRCQWTRAISVRIASGNGRDCIRPASGKHSTTVEQAIFRLEQRRKYFNLTEWEKKLGNKLSSYSSRRRRKANAKASRKGSGGFGENCEVWKQMCIDWVGDNP